MLSKGGTNGARQLKQVSLYTDGACSGNPGAGGWGCVLVYGDFKKEMSGFESDTTNNRMEISAVIYGLRALKERCDVTVYSDSQYVVDAFQKGWIQTWQKNGWKNASKQPVKNTDLWEILLKEISGHNVRWIKVKGHSDNALNNRCDALATGEIKEHNRDR